MAFGRWHLCCGREPVWLCDQWALVHKAAVEARRDVRLCTARLAGALEGRHTRATGRDPCVVMLPWLQVSELAQSMEKLKQDKVMLEQEMEAEEELITNK